MSYLYDNDECSAMEPGARPDVLERDDAECRHWRRQCEKTVEFRRRFTWHGNEPARTAARKEFVS